MEKDAEKALILGKVISYNAAGHQYTGDFYSNTRQGEGLFYYPDGSKYNGKFALKQGSFVAGKREGHGVYLYPNGDVYQGEWQGDLKHGFGTYIYSNGSKKKGVWVKGSLSGAGEIIHADHKITGIFFNDKDMKMPVQLTFPSSGYSKTITNPSLVGMQPSPVY
jgi:radial spoke head protein 1